MLFKTFKFIFKGQHKFIKHLVYKILIIQSIFSLFYPFIGLAFSVKAASQLNVKIFEQKKFESGQSIDVPINVFNDTDFDWTDEFKLAYHWVGIINDKNFTDLITPVLINNNTSADQQINIKVPNKVGQYTLQIDLYNSSLNKYLSELGEITTYDIQITIADTELPTNGIINFLEGPQTEDRNVTLNISATDNIEVAEMRIGQSLDLSNFTWETYATSKNITLSDVPGIYTYYIQFKDSSGNISPPPFSSSTINLINNPPVGTITLDGGEEEALNTDINLDFSQITDESQIVGFKYAINEPNLTNISYTSAFLSNLNITIPDQTGDYTVYAQFKDEWGNESQVISDSIHYTHYDIQPEISGYTDNALFGGKMDYSITLKNNGSDIGYNGLIEIELPRGFSYIEGSSVIKGEQISPTYSDIGSNGNQILKYQSVADLLSGELVDIKLKIKVGGQIQGYSIGDTVQVKLKGSLFKRIDWNIGFYDEVTHNIELLPFTSSISSTGTGGTTDILVGSEMQNEITIQSNPEINADTTIETEQDMSEPNPVVVMFELENGIEYLDGSENVENYSGDYIFNKAENQNNVFVLSWIFGNGLKIENYTNPLVINFYTKLLKFNADDELILHNDKLTTNIGIDATYKGNNYSQNQNSEVTAKYFTVSKTGAPNKPNILDEVEYKVTVRTSEYYNFSGITITDILPDGIEYIDNSSTIPLFNNVYDPLSGKTTLTWQIFEINKNSEYTFSYKAILKQNYESLDELDKRILAGDSLTNNLTIETIWSDPNPINDQEQISGVLKEQDSDTKNINTPILTSEITRINGEELHSQNVTLSRVEGQVDILVGDFVNVKTNVLFPEDVPTNNFNFKIYIPVGTKIVGDLLINSIGNFENSPSNYTSITGGYNLNLGKVEPGSSLEIAYQLEILDDPNLKMATVIRNLYRADYTNTLNEKFTLRDELTFVLIEPKIEIEKSYTGYLASGEEAIVTLVIKNTGTSTAYNLNFSDTIPNNSTLDSIISNDQNCQLIIQDLEPEEQSPQLKAERCQLTADSSFSFSYRILPASGLITRDDMSSKVTVSNYQSRPESDPKAKRYFSIERNYNWKATEPAIVTDLTRQNFPSETIVKAGRDDNFTLIASTKNVGGSPMYNSVSNIDLSQTIGLVADINNIPYTVLIDNQDISGTNLYNFTVSNGTYTFSNLYLLNGQTFRVLFNFQTERFAEFGLNYPIKIISAGNNALGDPIRIDASHELSADIDADDRTNKDIEIYKLDTTPPIGIIYFEKDGKYINSTNKSEVNIEYSAFDVLNPNGVKNEIIAIKFSNDGVNFESKTNLPLCDFSNCPNVAKGWNSWDGELFREKNSTLTSQGENYRYIEVMDLYENIYIAVNAILVDTLPPTDANVFITPKENEFENIEYTGKLNNFIKFTAQDDYSQGYYSDIGEYQYSFDSVNWSGWNTMTSGINTLEVDFPKVSDGEKLQIFMKVRDLAENEYPEIISDNIIYTEEKPEVSINLNNGDEFTNYSLVSLELNFTDTNAGVDQIRFAPNEDIISNVEWLDINDDLVSYYPLFESWETGNKTLCIQLRDNATNESNIACDSITLDFSPPIGSVTINNGNTETSTQNVLLNIEADDPILNDGNPGIGSIKMRISQTSQLVNEFNYWSEWIDLTDVLNFNLTTTIGEAIVYIQFEDGLGNLSDIYSDKIIVDTLSGSGNILINNGDLFTDNSIVNLTLNADMENLGYPEYQNPVLMRFIQTNNNDIPPYPPTVDDPSDDSSGWQYWEEFPTTSSGGVAIIRWELDWQQETSNSQPNYGQKNVYVQYMMPNGDVTNLYYDSIIYAPLYGIEYSSVQLPALSTQQNTYTLNNIPTEVLTQEQFTIKFNAHNLGSLTWEKSGDHPVKITYRWVAVTSENDPIGLPAEASAQVGTSTLDDYRGNAVILPKNIAWNEETGELSLLVDTPVFAGKYKLVIDAIQEGVTWFSTYGNVAPTYTVDVIKNPNIPEPEILGTVTSPTDNIGGYPGCKPWGTRYTLRGVLQVANTNPWNVNYKIVEPDGTTWWIGNIGFEPYVGQEVEVTIEFRPWVWGTSCYDFVVIPGTLQLVPKTWIAQKWWQNYPENSKIYLYRGSSVNLELDYRNNGTGVWNRNYTFLYAVNTNPFEHINIDKNNIPMRSDYIDVGQGSTAKFPFTIKVPDTVIDGSYTICYSPKHTQYSLSFDSQTCYTIQVESTEAEKRAYRCAQPQTVYAEIPNSTNPNPAILGYLNKDEEFIQIGSQIINGKEWIRIYYPHTLNVNDVMLSQGGEPVESRVEAWIENSDTCFENITVVENPIQQTVLERTSSPTDDYGYIIATDGINMYDCPSEMCPIIAKLSYNEKIRVLQQTEIIDGHPGWLYIEKLSTGEKGWIPKGYSTYVNNPPVTSVELKPLYRAIHICGGSILTRTGPGENYPEKGIVSSNYNTNVIMKWNDWYLIYVDSNGVTGWINSQLNVCNGYYSASVAGYSGNIDGQIFYKNLQYTFPIDSRKVTSPFGPRILGSNYDLHTGVDYVPQSGNACGQPVYAASDGIVNNAVKGFTRGGFDISLINKANYVTIDHPNGTRTRYFHLKDVYVSIGQAVTRGQIIGTIGNTGYTTGCHLHFELWDDKNNRSSVIDPEVVFNQLGIGGSGTKDTPYGDFNIDNVSKDIQVEAEIDKNNVLHFTKLNLPAPTITYVTSEYPTGKVDIYGNSLNKNFTFYALSKVKKYSKTFGEASATCNININFYYLNIPCLSNQMGLQQYEFVDFINKSQLECISRYIYGSIGYNQCMSSQFKTTEFSTYIDLPLENTELILIKNGSEDITLNRLCDTGATCYNNSARYWNDTTDGNWQMAFDSTYLKPNDKVSAKLRVFSDVSLSYNGKTYSGNLGNGWESGLSNEEVVPSPQATPPIGFPFRNVDLFPYTSGSYNTKAYEKYFGSDGNNRIENSIGFYNGHKRGVMYISRGGLESGHPANAIDFGTAYADYNENVPPIVVSTMDGTTSIEGEKNFGHTEPVPKNGIYICPDGSPWLAIRVSSNSNKTTYGHLSPLSLNLKNFKNNSNILRGTPVGFVGNTGCSSGPHLHYEVNSVATPSALYSSLSDIRGLSNLPENLYNLEDQGKMELYENCYLDTNCQTTPIIDF